MSKQIRLQRNYKMIMRRLDSYRVPIVTNLITYEATLEPYLVEAERIIDYVYQTFQVVPWNVNAHFLTKVVIHYRLNNKKFVRIFVERGDVFIRSEQSLNRIEACGVLGSPDVLKKCMDLGKISGFVPE